VVAKPVAIGGITIRFLNVNLLTSKGSKRPTNTLTLSQNLCICLNKFFAESRYYGIKPKEALSYVFETVIYRKSNNAELAVIILRN